MTDEAPRFQPMVVRRLGAEEAAATRVRIVHRFLDWVLELKHGLDATQWQNIGGPEFEYFVEALIGGSPHPALADWNNRIDPGNPGLPPYETRARRLAVLMVIALSRACFPSQSSARRYVAHQLSQIFDATEPLTEKAIAKWQERLQPPITPADEQLMATGIAVCGRHEPRKLCLYFIGLIHLARNPTAIFPSNRL